MKPFVPSSPTSSRGILASKKFGFAATPHTFRLLTAHYSDPKWAMVREYGTNFLDAYTRLKQLYPDATIILPIIHLPSALEPYLGFKDFGIGMSFHEVWDILTTAGESTKWDQPLAVGGLGVGFKVGFAYGDGINWTVESIYGGEKMSFFVGIGEDGMPELHHVGTEPTDEHSGVDIRIPILPADYEYFQKCVQRLYETFPMEFIVEGATVTLKKPKYLVETPDWAYQDSNNPWNVSLVMGNVRYPVAREQVDALKEMGNRYYAQLELRAPINAVDIPPNREALMYTDRTKAWIAAAAEQVKAELMGELNKLVEQKPNLWEATKMAYELRNLASPLKGDTKGFRWHDRTIEVSLYNDNASIAVMRADLEADGYRPVDIEKYSNENKVSVFERTTAGGVTVKVARPSYVFLDDIPEGKTRRHIPSMVREFMTESVSTPSRYRRRRRDYKSGASYIVKAANLTLEKLTEYLGGFPVELLSSLPPPEPREYKRGYVATPAYLRIMTDSEHYISINDSAAQGHGTVYWFPIAAGVVHGLGLPSASLWKLIVAAKQLRLTQGPIVGIPRTRSELEKTEGWVEFVPFMRKEIARLARERALAVAQRKEWGDLVDHPMVRLLGTLAETANGSARSMFRGKTLLRFARTATMVMERRSIDELATAARVLGISTELHASRKGRIWSRKDAMEAIHQACPGLDLVLHLTRDTDVSYLRDRKDIVLQMLQAKPGKKFGDDEEEGQGEGASPDSDNDLDGNE